MLKKKSFRWGLDKRYNMVSLTNKDFLGLMKDLEKVAIENIKNQYGIKENKKIRNKT